MTKICWLVTRQLAKISSELCYFVSPTSFFSKSHTCVLCDVGRAFQLPPFILGRKELGRLVSPVLLFPKLAELLILGWVPWVSFGTCFLFLSSLLCVVEFQTSPPVSIRLLQGRQFPEEPASSCGRLSTLQSGFFWFYPGTNTANPCHSE